VIGSIRSFVPSRKSGVLLAETGQEIPFSVADDGIDLHGGDLVTFDIQNNGRLQADNVSLHCRWIDLLNQNHPHLVSQFYETVMIDY